MNTKNTTLKSTIVGLIHRCNSIKHIKQIHAQIVTCGIWRDSFVIAKFVEFLGRFGRTDYAHEVLHQILPYQSLFLYNSLMTGCETSKTPELALLVYKKMIRHGYLPDKYTFPVILKSCAKFIGFRESEQIHLIVLKMGFVLDIFVLNALIHVYGVCGVNNSAAKLFVEMPQRDVVSWTSLINGYTRSGLFDEALKLFKKMDVEPSIGTFVSALVACGKSEYMHTGKTIHGLIFKHQPVINLVLGNALIDMYVKCKCLDFAKKVFKEIPCRDIVSWTTMVSGLVQCNHHKEALEVFNSMKDSGMEPDKVIIASILSACASLGALDFGKWVHEYVNSKGIEWDIHLGTAIVNMYIKCGCVEIALNVFKQMPTKNIITWNALLGGLAMNGHSNEVLQKFEQMIHDGVGPNKVTFLALLTACCHSGWVYEGQYYFDLMAQVHNIRPTIQHYGCMVDLLGRVGNISEAWNLVKAMPMQPDVLILGSLLNSCRVHGNIDFSQKLLGHLLEFDKQEDSGIYVLLSNIYAANDRWEDVTRVRKFMKVNGIRKSPGSSVIEVDKKKNDVLVGDVNNLHYGRI